VTWASAAARSRLVVQAKSGVAARWDVGTSPALLIPDRIAYAAIGLLCHVDLSRLKACPPQDGGCGWLFVDHTRNGSRRWCSMDDCGTQAKIRRLTQRRRAAVTPKDKTTRPTG
jgi:predicted RNA-binding Zn ribbon-like protein